MTEVEKGKYVVTFPKLPTTKQEAERHDAKIETKDIRLPQSFTLELWRITVESIQFLTGTRNLQFELLIEALQSTPMEFYINDQTYLLDNLGNQYKVSSIVPAGRRKAFPGMPIRARLIFPELNESAEAIVFYFRFYGADIKNWTIYYNYVERAVGPISLVTVSTAKKPATKEITLPRTFAMDDGSWSVTVTGYQVIGQEKVQFFLLIDNLQKDISEFRINKKATYLLDNLGKEYRNVEVSREYEKVLPGTPVMSKIVFSELNKEAETGVLYLEFMKSDGTSKIFAIGPIKLR